LIKGRTNNVFLKKGYIFFSFSNAIINALLLCYLNNKALHLNYMLIQNVIFFMLQLDSFEQDMRLAMVTSFFYHTTLSADYRKGYTYFTKKPIGPVKLHRPPDHPDFKVLQHPVRGVAPKLTSALWHTAN